MSTGLSWDSIWDLVKTLILPIVGFVWFYLQKRQDVVETEIKDLQSSVEAIEKDNIQIKANYATKTELNRLIAEINRSLQENNVALEIRLEKIIDLKNEPIKTMLIKLVDKK